jgi:ribosomal protein S18 acetylase RimI-like enzyme
MQINLIKNLSERQIDDLNRLYQSQWWSRGRKKADIDRMLKHTDLIVAFCDASSNQLVAFSRVLTDYVDRATIYDVIVDETYQGQGLGKKLIDAIANHSALKSVEKLDLCCCPDLILFYQKWGFIKDGDGICLMSRKQH